MTKQTDIIIANPMYDVVFKSLMEDKEIARYFVETIIDEEIVEIEFAQQEYTYYIQTDTETETKPENKTKELKVIRLDFIASIRTKEGDEKKVLIEIQQSLNPIDVFRFRSYLAKQYSAHENIIKEEKIIVKNDKVTIEEKIVDIRSIIAIYMLGFEIDDLPYIISKFVFKGNDVVSGCEVNTKHPIVKELAHEAYYVQVPRINPEIYANWSECSRLMKLLSLFEQNYFVVKKHLKEYIYTISKTDKILKKMINKLEQMASDSYTRRVMEEQEFAAMNMAFWKQAIVNKDNIIAAVSAERDNAWNTITALQSNNAALQSNNAALQHQIEEYLIRYGKLN